MKIKDKIFLCTYTADNKNYCDEQFFTRFNEIEGYCHCVVDNTTGTEDYYQKIVKRFAKDLVFHLAFTPEPKHTIFQRKVAGSVNKCREEFLKTDCEYMLIIESDVIPPKDVLDHFEKSLSEIRVRIASNPLEIKPFGILGALYYVGFHDYTITGIHQTHHCLSGCTLYKRELIEKYPFRHDEKKLEDFPDATISFDAGKEYSLWNDHDVKCDHKEHLINGSRYSKPII